jgi:hypothetical protein
VHPLIARAQNRDVAKSGVANHSASRRVFDPDAQHFLSRHSIFNYISDDGVDVCGCDNVTVVHSFVHNADDGFIAKAWTRQGAFSVSHSTVFSTVGSAFGANDEIATEANYGVFRDNIVIHSTNTVSTYGGVLSVNTAMSGVVEKFLFENIVINQLSPYGYEFATINATLQTVGTQEVAVVGRGILDGRYTFHARQLHQLLAVQFATAVTIEVVILREGAAWNVFLDHAQDVYIHDVKILGLHGVGLDVGAHQSASGDEDGHTARHHQGVHVVNARTQTQVGHQWKQNCPVTLARQLGHVQGK